MRVLGIDYGEAKVGVAFCEGKLAEPLVVLKDNGREEMSKRVRRIVEEKGIEKVIVGVSGGLMEGKQRAFGAALRKASNVPVEYYDETLTSKDAIRMGIEAGVGRKRRQEMEDAYAAAVMLQGWVDK